MIVSDATILRIDPASNMDGFALNYAQEDAVRNALKDNPSPHDILIVNGVAGIDLVLMGRAISGAYIRA